MIQTARLILRSWTFEDIKPYFYINQNPKVIEYLPKSLTLKQIEDFIVDMNAQEQKFGFTLWAATLKETGHLIGFIGLNCVNWEAPFTPAVEIGWRLDSKYWGKGYATEGAKSALEQGFKLSIKEIVAFTVPNNRRSISVMERIGMVRDLDGDFNHPKLPLNHKLSKHILYRINDDNI